MEEEKKVLPTPPKELNQRPLPPRPPKIQENVREEGKMSTAENNDGTGINSAVEKQNENTTETQNEKQTEKPKEKKEKFWNRKPVLWSGIVLGVALVGVIIFCIVAL